MAQLNLPCGCQQRKEIMSQGNWQADAVLVGGLALVVAVVCCVKYGGRK